MNQIFKEFFWIHHNQHVGLNFWHVKIHLAPAEEGDNFPACLNFELVSEFVIKDGKVYHGEDFPEELDG